MSLFKSKNMGLLLMEVDGFVHPAFKDIRDLLYGIDHGGNLNVQSFSKKSLHFRSVSCLGLCHKILKLERYVWKLSSFLVATCMRLLSSSLTVSA